MRSRNRIFRIMLAVITVLTVAVLGFVVVEQVLSAQEHWHGDEIDFIFHRPPPFAQAPFLNDEFVAEIRSIVFLPDEDGIQRPKDHTGKEITIREGWRVTPGQPSQALHTVYVFGNSTLLGREVPDSLTITALLQKLLPGYRFENRGVYAGSTENNLHDLKRTNLNPGDVVIFYGGNAEGASASNQADRQQADAMPFWCKQSRLRQFATIRAVCDRSSGMPPLLQDTEWLAKST